MPTQRFRRVIARHFAWWCIAGVLLAAFQPFLFSHFRQDGWEDEAMFGIRGPGSGATFEADDRGDHPHALETTLYVPAGAHIDAPDALQQGLDALMDRVGSLAPLAVLVLMVLLPVEPARRERMAHPGGAPPPAKRTFVRPPKTAPPQSS